MIFAAVDFFYSPSQHFSTPSLFSLSPSNGTVVEIQTYVQSEECSAFLILFLSECG